MCTNLNLGVVEIELDVKIVFDWVAEEYSNSLYHTFVILDCRILIS